MPWIQDLVRHGHCHVVPPNGTGRDGICSSTDAHVGLSDRQCGLPTAGRQALAVEPLLRRHVEEVGGVAGASDRLAQVPVFIVRVRSVHVVVQRRARREGAQENPHKGSTSLHLSTSREGSWIRVISFMNLM